MSNGPLHKSLSLRRQNQHVLWTANKHACPLDCIQLSFGQQLSMSQDCYNKECMSFGPLHSNQSQSPGRQQLLGHFCGLTNNPPRGTVTHVCHGAICATLDAAFCVHHSTALHILQCFHALVCVSYDTWHRYNDVTTSLNINACQLHCQCNNFLCVCDRCL